MTTVTVVIVSFNTRELLLRCLRTIPAVSGSIRTEVIVVDNASHDGSAAAVREDCSSTRVVELANNVGFAEACNLGASLGSGEHVLLLNPDTEMQPGCLTALADLNHRRPDAGVIGGRTLTPDHRLDPHSCWALPSLWSMACFATGLSTVFASNRVFDPESLGRWARDDERQVGVVTGCLLWCSREVWDRLGGLDASYFVYGEDVDFCDRARAAGYHPMIAPGAELVHIGGASSSTGARKWHMILRGKVTYMRRRWSRGRARLGIALLLAGAALRAIAASAHVPVAGPWAENWRTRAQWLDGWQPEHRRAPVILADSGGSAGE